MPTVATTGHPTIAAFGGGATGYLAQVDFGSSVACRIKLFDLLWKGAYPRWLKERVCGAWGHLDNGQAGSLLAALDALRSAEPTLALREAIDRIDPETEGDFEAFCASRW